jgi:hypothetical protein
MRAYLRLVGRRWSLAAGRWVLEADIVSHTVTGTDAVSASVTVTDTGSDTVTVTDLHGR